MAVTAQQVFDIAMVLMDEVTETGNISTDAPEYYKTKALSILTTLQSELSDTTVILTDLSQPLALSDHEAITILPYGLAAHILLSENINKASFFNNRYDELKQKRKAVATAIIDNYNVLHGFG